MRVLVRSLPILLLLAHAVAAAAALPQVRGGRGRDRPLVLIDPGHGGHDPGTVAADGEQEKDVVLAIARAVRDALMRSGRVRVALTREDDRFLPLPARAALARRLRAALFVSIHADSAPNLAARGASVYTLSDVASDGEAARLAARENRAGSAGGIDLKGQPPGVRSILADLAQRETMNLSAAFADRLRREMGPRVRFRATFHRFADFSVLRSGGVPAVLFETGYLSNRDDARFLVSAAGRRAVAEGIKTAIEVHLAQRRLDRPPPAPAVVPMRGASARPRPR